MEGMAPLLLKDVAARPTWAIRHGGRMRTAQENHHLRSPPLELAADFAAKLSTEGRFLAHSFSRRNRARAAARLKSEFAVVAM